MAFEGFLPTKTFFSDTRSFRGKKPEESPTVTIREATPADYSKMAELSLRDAEKYGGPSLTKEKLIANFAGEGSLKGITHLVAEVGGEFAGYYSVSRENNFIPLINSKSGTTHDAYSWGFYVEEKFQNRGIGTQLRLQGFRMLLAEGKKKVFGIVYEKNPTVAYYESIGGEKLKNSEGEEMYITSHPILGLTLRFGSHQPLASFEEKLLIYSYDLERSIKLLEKKLQRH